MFCKECGSEINDKAVICTNCGVSTVKKQSKSAVLALILSLLCPGLGQAYNNEWGKGIVMFLVFWITIWFVIGLIVWLWSMIDAAQVAEKINNEL